MLTRNEVMKAVETFVEDHYQQQIRRLAKRAEWAPLRTRLQHFCAEEVHHRDEAAGAHAEPPGRAARIWMRIIEAGSAAGVRAARAL